MAKVKGKSKDITQLSARVPKELADKLNGHANQLGMTFTDVMVLALQGYIASPESRLPVVEAKLRRTELELKSLRSHIGLPNGDVKNGTGGDQLSALLGLESPK
jgi:hypothetical protein